MILPAVYGKKSCIADIKKTLILNSALVQDIFFISLDVPMTSHRHSQFTLPHSSWHFRVLPLSLVARTAHITYGFNADRLPANKSSWSDSNHHHHHIPYRGVP